MPESATVPEPAKVPPGAEEAPAPLSPWRRALRQLVHDRAALVSTALIALLVIMAVAAPLLVKLEGQDPYTYHIGLLNQANGSGPKGILGGMSGAHWFGVEPLTGRDMFALVVYGAQTSLLVGLASTAVSIIIGAVVGTAAAFFGGWLDAVIGRTADVFLAFPGMIFMIALGIVVPQAFPRWLLLVIVIGFFGWPGFARIIRGQALSLVRREFVDAARTLGAGPGHIIFRELMPNLMAPIIVFSAISIPQRIGTEAALSFLGVGVPAPTPDWGRTISDATDWVQTDLMYLLFPGGALFLAVLAFTVLGDSLRDALDPRTRR
ncbi:peptide ABC transporter permease [Mangrovactinospora gilvigrisea]|uniref:Peptide ABC transporter permease n=1 Tax=Mangrovactinospora gilvigrisea TaxID=1428644 RepID=A0A1J7CAX6_9ACTN|nr:ABC transporter permease [Mangrovactinospora gilvigrisea]OIV38672.1 peptide ABC transporter permease [Mangrovactinospora gilvigrisea]